MDQLELRCGFARIKDSVAERSKALVSGATSKQREVLSHRCQCAVRVRVSAPCMGWAKVPCTACGATATDFYSCSHHQPRRAGSGGSPVAQHGALQLFQACRAHILRAGQALPPQPGKGVSACCIMPAMHDLHGTSRDLMFAATLRVC